jgi:hypothetical protein
MQTKKKHSKRFTRTKRSSSTRNKLKRNQTGGTRSEIYVEIPPGTGNWQPAHWYQKKAFKDFVTQYTRGGLNMNPDNVYQYDKDGIKFNVLGEIYIVSDDGSRMRIKRVQLPEGTPDPDFDYEKPDGTDNKYYFTAANGSNYFNNIINQEIETNKRSSKNFIVGNGRYRVVLDEQVPPFPNTAVVKLGILQGMGNSYNYPLYYERRTAGWAEDAHGVYGGYPYAQVGV